jgi:electron transport complex protein RnfA
LLTGVVYAFSTAIGFSLALVLFAGIREQMNLVKIPKEMEGTLVVLIIAGLLAMAFMGFSGGCKDRMLLGHVTYQENNGQVFICFYHIQYLLFYYIVTCVCKRKFRYRWSGTNGRIFFSSERQTYCHIL